MTILWWLVPSLVVTLAAMAWVRWVANGATGSRLDDPAVLDRIGRALGSPTSPTRHQSVRSRPQSPLPFASPDGASGPDEVFWDLPHDGAA